MARAFSVEDGGLDKTSTVKSSRAREFLDLDLSFSAKGAGDVYKKTSIASVKQALRNILMTQRTEKPFAPYFGANLREYLFEHADYITENKMNTAIIESVRAYEPRINPQTIKVFSKMEPDKNSITLTIIFNIQNSASAEEFTTRLTRLR
jgi:phage baseplate assembly protein W